MIKEINIVIINKNNYLISPRKSFQPLYLHPMLVILIKENQTKKISLNKALQLLKNNYVSKEIKYFYTKLKLYEKNGLLDNVEFVYTHTTAKQIENNFFNAKYLTFGVTDSCNLKCEYCAVLGEYYADNNLRENAKLDLKTGKRYIDYIFSKTKNNKFPYQFSISFYGGEPLLNFSFIKGIIEYNKEKRPKQDFRYNMTTNALLLHKYMDFLVGNKFDLLISLDGDIEHNKFRIKKMVRVHLMKSIKTLNC